MERIYDNIIDAERTHSAGHKGIESLDDKERKEFISYLWKLRWMDNTVIDKLFEETLNLL